VDGGVRVTDVPLALGGRAYLVELGLEEEGAAANVALQALLADYLRQASVLDEVPMAAEGSLASRSAPKCARPKGIPASRWADLRTASII
jgi:hypothetical protein